MSIYKNVPKVFNNWVNFTNHLFSGIEEEISKLLVVLLLAILRTGNIAGERWTAAHVFAKLIIIYPGADSCYANVVNYIINKPPNSETQHNSLYIKHGMIQVAFA